MNTLFLLTLLTLTGCTQQHIQLNYKDDGYLTYNYPTETMPNITFRQSDYYVNLITMHEKGYDVEGYEEADQKLRKIVEWQQDANPKNTIIQYESQKQSALDTMCIIALQYDDKATAEHLTTYLTNDNNLIADDYYEPESAWRNIADESWCVMLFTRTNTGPAEEMLMTKLKEAEAFWKDHNQTQQAAITIHVLMMLKETSNHEKAREHWLRRATTLLNSKELAENNLLLANLIDIIDEYNYAPALTLKYKNLLRAREHNGIWTPIEGGEDNYGQIFTKTRVLIALA